MKSNLFDFKLKKKYKLFYILYFEYKLKLTNITSNNFFLIFIK